jgi:hypothetical protein
MQSCENFQSTYESWDHWKMTFVSFHCMGTYVPLNVPCNVVTCYFSSWMVSTLTNYKFLKKIVAIQWKVIVNVARHLARFQLLSIIFLTSEYFMCNYDSNNLMERDLQCMHQFKYIINWFKLKKSIIVDILLPSIKRKLWKL